MAAKTPKKKFPFEFRFSYILLLFLVLWMITMLSSTRLVPTGTLAPDFNLKVASNGGAMMSLSSLKGKTVVLDFWGIGCPPCMQEIHELQAIWQELKDKDVMVVGVAAWGENRTDVMRLKQQKGATYPMLLGHAEMVSAYKVESLPTLYVIDKEGKVVAAREGFWDRESLKKTVLKAAGE